MAAARVEVHVQEGLELPVRAEALESAALTVLAREGAARAELSFAVVDDAEIERLNREYLDHDGPTDVISFPLPGPGDSVVGDVYIGAEQARRQASDLGVPFAEELLRLTIHGALHVLGYDHPEGDDREGSEMYRRQEELLREVLHASGGRR